MKELHEAALALLELLDSNGFSQKRYDEAKLRLRQALAVADPVEPKKPRTRRTSRTSKKKAGA